MGKEVQAENKPRITNRKRTRRRGSGEQTLWKKLYDRTGLRGKTAWDWLQLLVVPVLVGILAVGLTAWFNNQQSERQQEIEDQRAQQQQEIEDQRAEAERNLAEQRAQDEALQAYLDQMSQLILDRDLLESQEGDPVYTLAQARTATIILRLDAEHNESVINFLRDSGLDGSDQASIGLLTGTELNNAALDGSIDLSGANLSGIALRGANLLGIDLSWTNLSDADLLGADLSGANLLGANLRSADLSAADLSWASLSGADLSDADLLGADLSGADLLGADLSEARLQRANLKGAIVANEQLGEASLEGATMPNDQKYEDWLKDRKGRGEDGENSSS